MATGFPVKANYATGDVLTAANMNDLSGTVNYLQYMPPRNPVLNSNMSVWQRGTSFTPNAATYCADRWQGYRGTTGMTVTRQTTSDTTNLPFIQYCTRVARDSGNTSTTALAYAQSLESVNSIPFAGKTVTLSFYARAGANYSAASSALLARLDSGTGTDQNVISGYTGGASIIYSTATLTTTWQRFSYTGTVSATATELGLQFVATPVGTAGAADYFEVTGVQLELGSVANTYMPNQPTYQGELAACQRYYWRVSPTAANAPVGTNGMATSTTAFRASLPFKQTMRVVPTSVDFANLQIADGVSGYAITAITYGASTDFIDLQITSSGMTQFRGGWIVTTNTSGYLGWNAEL